jgi:N-methylhydantoinase B
VSTVDPVTREIVKGALRSAQKQMEAVIDRTAMSPFLREKKDYFAGILDRQGHVVVGTKVPVFGNLMGLIFETYDPADMRPGDVYTYNDCYASVGGVSHSPDFVIAAPYFDGDELVAFAEVSGHFWDIGGIRPGSISPDAREIFHEGIIFPAVKIIEEGRLNDEVFRILTRNSRFPDILHGDFQAMLAACQLGAVRLKEMFDRFGRDVILAAWADYERQTHRMIREELEQRIPVGEYAVENGVDTDGVSKEPFVVRMRLSRTPDRISIDTRESDDQAAGPINFVMHESVPQLLMGLYMLADHPDLILNYGAQSAIDDVFVRQGSMLRPNWPAPLGNRSHTLARVQSCVLGLLAEATNGEAPAASPVYNICFFRGSDPEWGSFLCSDGIGVGFGARPFADGLDSIYYVAQKNYPAEFIEMSFPIRLLNYALHPDSGGPGRYRGGCGVIREYEMLAAETTVATRLDNITCPAKGVGRGQPGRAGRVYAVGLDGREREIVPMSDGNVVRRGERLRVFTSGGGGWGDPLVRPVESVLTDVFGGFVSRQSAAEDYGVVLRDGSFEVDAEATRRARAAAG